MSVASAGTACRGVFLLVEQSDRPPDLAFNLVGRVSILSANASTAKTKTPTLEWAFLQFARGLIS